MFYEFKGYRPVVDPSAFVHPQAAVTGNVVIGKDVYIGPGAAIRGDWGQIIIEDGCNVQENCTIHQFPGVTVRLREGAHMGHGSIVHGATIGRNCLIGMNSVIMDGAEIGDECIVGALSFIKAGEKVPARSVIAGNPAKILKAVSEEMLKWKTEGTAIYQALPQDMFGQWKACEPLRPGDEPETAEHRTVVEYKPWKETTSMVEEPAAPYGRRSMTVQDYLDIERGSTVKHEYYNGEVFAMAGAKPDHNIITANLSLLIGMGLKARGCRIFPSDQRVHVEKNNFFTYPDLSIVCGKAQISGSDEMHLINPVAIVEVMSPSTRNYDRGEKFELYKGIETLQEYLLIDSTSLRVEHFVKDEAGAWTGQKYHQPADSFVLRTGEVAIRLEAIYEDTGFPKLTY